MRPTAKHELYAQYLADGMTQAAAYVKAGFSPKTKASAEQCASRLVKSKPSIAKRRDALLACSLSAKSAALAAVTAKVAAEFGLTKNEVLTKMYDIYEKGIAAQPVLNSDGQPIGEYRTNLNAALAALKLLGGEVHDMFVDKKEVRTGRIEDLTYDELQQKWEVAQQQAGVTLPALPKLPGGLH